MNVEHGLSRGFAHVDDHAVAVRRQFLIARDLRGTLHTARAHDVSRKGVSNSRRFSELVPLCENDSPAYEGKQSENGENELGRTGGVGHQLRWGAGYRLRRR